MSTRDVVLPFPWRSLEAISRESVSALWTSRRWASRHVRLEALATALEAIVATDVRILVRRASPGAAGVPLEGGVAIALGLADDGESRATALVEVESPLAASVVGRVLRRPSTGLSKLDGPASGPLAGGFAAIVVAAARRAHGGAVLHAIAAGSAEALEPAFVRANPEALSVGLTVVVSDQAFAARCLIAAPALPSAEVEDWNSTKLSSLGAVPLSLPLVACATLASASDVAALRRGDVWLPGSWPLELAGLGDAAAERPRDAGPRGLVGQVRLAAPSSSVGLRARLVDPDRLVLSGEVDALCAPETTMSESGDADAVVEALGDVPVVVRVEIGEARMPARDWAAIRKGDVVTLGKRVGELVLLRVGGVPVARGELVSVDGEVGVRIVERIASESTTK
jgi:flagellar motor switch/type III secretory pathway protein FliN